MRDRPKESFHEDEVSDRLHHFTKWKLKKNIRIAQQKENNNKHTHTHTHSHEHKTSENGQHSQQIAKTIILFYHRI